jgi:hypothetical protein
MGSGTLPKDPAKRKVLVIVDEHDFERLMYEGGSNVLLDRESWVINTDDLPKSDLIRSLDQMNLLVPGHILIQNPYQVDTYIAITNATSVIAASKHHLFNQFCFLLGAKQILITQVEVITREGSISVKAEGGNLAYSGNGEVKYEEFRHFGQQLTIRVEASGGPADLASAKNFLCDHRLVGDQHFLSLLEMCKHKGNVLQKHTMKISLTDQAKTNLNIAAKLKAPAFSFSADIERTTNRSLEFNLTLEVEFPHN